jgi:hypothetical protein
MTEKVRMAKLTPYEKETVINYSMASNIATIWSANRTEIGKLKRKKLKVVNETPFGAEFEIDKKYVLIRKPREVKKKKSSKEKVGTRVPTATSRKKTKSSN